MCRLRRMKVRGSKGAAKKLSNNEAGRPYPPRRLGLGRAQAILLVVKDRVRVVHHLTMERRKGYLQPQFIPRGGQWRVFGDIARSRKL